MAPRAREPIQAAVARAGSALSENQAHATASHATTVATALMRAAYKRARDEFFCTTAR